METQNVNDYMSKIRLCSMQELREIARKLELKSNGKREELARLIVSFLLTPEGRNEAYRKLDLNFANSFYDQIKTSNRLPEKFRCICEGGSGATIECTRCKFHQHTSCMGRNTLISPYECPTCQLYQMQPLDEVVEFYILPNSVPRDFIHGTQCERNFTFLQSQLDKIHSAKGALQIQARCLRIDGIGYTHQWPKVGCLIVNGRTAMEFRGPEHSNAKARKDEPLNLTTLFVPGKNSVNLLRVADTESFFWALVLIKKRSDDHFIKEVCSKPGLSVEQGKAFLIKKLNSGDSDIQSRSVKLSIKCPFTMTLMEIPVRGTKCDHLQCFNLDPFVRLQKSSKVNRWRCPICKGLAFDLIVDKFMAEIVEHARVLNDPHSVELMSDGTYRIISFEEYLESINKKEEESGKAENEAKKKRKTEKDDSINLNELMPAPVQIQKNNGNPQVVDLIDLD
ncbi:unnamed protein product [Blepharisma stoltei]|uniref:SP-RING-type domain-containing protein n=1 Tax=Blepharisma stoltei TaxID=1481888 RepID=A0AAU9IXQ4_9CILI|nr:unnamed protein product [Blepharisma stoltei]